jgi:hypothetical protein
MPPVKRASWWCGLWCVSAFAQAEAPEARTFRPVAARGTLARAIRATPCGETLSADLDGRGRREFIRYDEAGLRVDDAAPRALTPSAAECSGFAVADLDGDGRPELLLFRRAPAGLAAFDDGGRPLYTAALPAAAGYGVLDDGDGYDDVVVYDAAGGGRRFEAVPAPLRTLRSATPLARLAFADWDRDGATDVLTADAAGRTIVRDRFGRELFAADFGGQLASLTPLSLEEDPLGLDLAGATGDTLFAIDDEGRRRFAVPFVGQDHTVSLFDYDGVYPSEILAASFADGASTVRLLRHDGEEIFRTSIGAKLRTVTSLRHPVRDRRLLALLPERSERLLVIDPLDGSGSFTYDLGAPIRSFSTADLRGDSRAEFLFLLQDGGLVVLDRDGSRKAESRPTRGRVTDVRVQDVDADDTVEVVATIDGGAAVCILDRGLAERLTMRPPAPATGWSVVSLDWDGAGRRTYAFLRDEDAGKGRRRLRIASYDARGRPRFTRTIPGGRARTLVGDFDADGRAELAIWTDTGRLVALDAAGGELWRLPCPAGFSGIRTIDLDRDGTDEILVQAPDGALNFFGPPPRDRTPRLAAFLRKLLASAPRTRA